MSWPQKATGGGAVDNGTAAVASGAIPANALVYINGSGQMALADATAEGKEAVGFTKASTANGVVGAFFTSGTLTGQTGLTPGNAYFMTTTPGVPGAAPSTTGNVVQRIGTALSATDISFALSTPITL